MFFYLVQCVLLQSTCTKDTEESLKSENNKTGAKQHARPSPSPNGFVRYSSRCASTYALAFSGVFIEVMNEVFCNAQLV